MSGRVRVMLNTVLLGISCELIFTVGFATAQESKPDWKCHIRGPIRVFYVTEGEDSVGLTDMD